MFIVLIKEVLHFEYPDFTLHGRVYKTDTLYCFLEGFLWRCYEICTYFLSSTE